MKKITWEYFYKVCKHLAKKVDDQFCPEIIVGIASGGVIVGATIASILKKEFFPIKISRKYKIRAAYNSPLMYVKPSKAIFNKKILLVDDMIATGNTLNLAVKELKKQNPKIIKTLAFAKFNNIKFVNFHGMTVDKCVIFPWNLVTYEKNKFIKKG